jgi:hypothetical protein
VYWLSLNVSVRIAYQGNRPHDDLRTIIPDLQRKVEGLVGPKYQVTTAAVLDDPKKVHYYRSVPVDGNGKMESNSDVVEKWLD